MLSARTTRTASYLAGVILVFALGLGIGSLFIRDRGVVPGDFQIPGDDRALADMLDTSQPLMTNGGVQTTLDSAEASVGWKVPTPDVAAAGVAGVPPSSEVWLSEETDEVGLRYGDALVILYTAWSKEDEKSAEATYRSQAQDFHAGYVSVIGSNPAWIVPTDSQAPGFPDINVVHVSIGPVDASLFSKMPLEDILKLAETL